MRLKHFRFITIFACFSLGISAQNPTDIANEYGDLIPFEEEVVVARLPSISPNASKNIKVLTESSGMISNRVEQILEDFQGNLWFITRKGVCKYNGLNFVNYLSQYQLKSGAIDNDGNLWFGTYKQGLIKYDGKEFRLYDESNGIPNTNIRKVVPAPNSGIFICHDYGISWTIDTCFKSKNFWANDFEAAADGIEFGPDSALLVATFGRGLIYYKNGKFSNHHHMTEKEEDKSLPSHKRKNKIRSVLVDKKGYLWVAARFRGLYRIKYSEWLKNKDLRTYRPIHKRRVYDIFEFEDVVWVAGKGGAYLFKDGVKVDSLSENDGFLNPIATHVFVDQSGLVWISGSSGMHIYERGAFDYFKIPNAEGKSYNCISRLDSATMIIGNEGNVYKVNNSLTQQEKIYGTRPSILNGIVLDFKKNLWLGLKGSFVASTLKIKSSSVFTEYKYRNILNKGHKFNLYYIYGGKGDNSYTNDLILDKNGEVWSGAEGVFKYNEDTVIIYDESDGLVTKETNALTVDNKNVIWAGTQRGVHWFDRNDNKFHLVSETEDLHITELFADSKGSIWVGVGLIGLYRIDANTKSLEQKFDKLSGLKSNNIQSIVEDKKGHVWVGTDKGIHRVLQNCDESCIRYYGISRGFISLNCEPNSVFCDHDGRIWWGTSKNITVYNPKDDFESESTPKLNLNSVKLSSDLRGWETISKDNSSIEYSEIQPWTRIPIDLVLPYDKNSLTISFSGIDWRYTGEIKYQYRFNSDNDWSQLSNNNEVSLTALEPGEHTFEVRCTVDNGLIFSNVIAYQFEILPPFWRTIWFYSLIIMFVGISTFLYIKARERSLKLRQTVLQKEVERRTLELSQEKNKVEQKNSEIEKQNNSILESINYAQRIQEAILPSSKAILKALPNSFVYYQPKDIVSGDFYWIYDAGDRVLFSAVDCTGHGVPGALMSIIGHSMLEKVVK
ncbi:MAG: hypothetical protein MRY83_19405, partial [Flavobacteriales bacterium]|nr:hypothetical protein [Flavobacteriales bacterium]